jgi:hypothetical protein
MQLGVGADNKIKAFSANTKTFFTYEDLNNNRSQVFAFTDRNGGGNSPGTAFPSLSHNAMMAHSIRGKVNSTDEGPRYCVTCHLTTNGLANYGTQYDAFRTAMATGNYGALDWQLLRTHFGRNPSNQLDSPLFVHMVAGLGTGLFLFDQNGAPVNPLDTDPNRKGAGGIAPATNFDIARVRLNLDRIVEDDGRSNGSSNHALLQAGLNSTLRDGAQQQGMAGPLGMTLIQRLTDPVSGIVLDAWIDADGVLRGFAGDYVK